MTPETDPRQALREALPTKCRDGCTVAKLAIDNFCRTGQALGDDDAEVFGRCLNGPVLVGECGTEKTVCSHPDANTTQVFNEQVQLLQNSLL